MGPSGLGTLMKARGGTNMILIISFARLRADGKSSRILRWLNASGVPGISINVRPLDLYCDEWKHILPVRLIGVAIGKELTTRNITDQPIRDSSDRKEIARVCFGKYNIICIMGNTSPLA